MNLGTQKEDSVEMKKLICSHWLTLMDDVLSSVPLKQAMISCGLCSMAANTVLFLEDKISL